MNATSKNHRFEESLTRRTLRGGFWMLLGRGSRWSLGFLRTVVLARLLAPDDFGLFGIAFLALGLLETCSRTGMWGALVRKSGDIEPYLDTVWTIGLIRAAGIATVLFFSAPTVASFFDTPGAETLVQASGLIVAFQSLSNIAVVFFEKEIEYGRVVTLDVSRTLVELLAAIASYFIFRNAWALMAGRIIGELAYCLLSYRIHPYRPKLSLSPGKAKSLFSYGKWILFSSILFFIVTQGDDLLVGKVLGVTVLGTYQMAFRISSLISTEVMMPILKVTFPAYSKLRDNPERLKEAYLKVLRVTSFIAFLVGFLQWTLADALVGALLGKNWAPVAGLLRILIFPACLRALQRTLVLVAKAMGHPDVQTKAGVLQLSILTILIYPAAVYWGASGVAFVVLLQGAAGFLWIASMVIPMVQLTYRDFLSPVFRQFLAAGIAAVVLFSIGQHLPDTLGALCLQGVLGVFLYSCMTWMLCRDLIRTLWNLTSDAGVGGPDHFGAALRER